MPFKSLRVMVVEDHVFERTMALRFLQELGVREAHGADDGLQALEMLAVAPQRLDIVVCDLDMPRMDGVAFLRNVAERKLANAIVVASGLEHAVLHAVETMARAYGLQVLGKIEKPLSAEKLAAVFAKYTEMRPVYRQAAPQRFERSELTAALESGAIRPVYQPKVRVETGTIAGVEALVRWHHPDHGLVLPGNFLASIERHGLLEMLTDRVLERSCADRQAWAAAGLNIGIAVNISMLSLTDVAVADRLHEIVRKQGCEPRDVTFEVTETSVMADTARALDVLSRLRIKGFGLSIDDFGTGHSTLQQLGTVPFTELKIDHSFVRHAPEFTNLRSSLEATLALARKLKLREVAEGVETRPEWDLLRSMHCEMAQGFFMSAGLPAEEIVPWSRRWRPPEA